MKQSEKPSKPSLFDIVKSVAAAAFGVQSSKNRERDFHQRSIVPYVVVGVIFVALFVIGLLTLVSQIVPS
jgi:hypothetical protein